VATIKADRVPAPSADILASNDGSSIGSEVEQTIDHGGDPIGRVWIDCAQPMNTWIANREPRLILLDDSLLERQCRGTGGGRTPVISPKKQTRREPLIRELRRIDDP
jgi:hypothetical protein